MKKIGIFLGFGPDQPIKNQGMGRLLAFILQGILERDDTQVVIASPAWHKNIILEFMQDQQIDLTKIELITTPDIPIVLRIKNFLSKLFPANNNHHLPVTENHHPVPPRWKRVLKRGKNFGLRKFFAWLSLSSMPLFIGIGLLFLFAIILLSPIILAILLIIGLHSLSQTLGQKIFPTIKKCLPKNMIASMTGPLAGLKNYSLAHEAYKVLRIYEMRKLIKQLNKRNDIPVWYVPSLFWPEIAALRAKKVVAVPDIVFVDFPSQFIDLHNYYHFTYQNITQSIAAADHFICYSDYVKQKHLVESFYIEPSKVSVINHGIVDLAPHLRIDSAYNATIESSKAAIKILQEYQCKKLQQHAYLRDFDFSNMRYIFYSSQIRPYKNFLNLLKAYEILLRKRFLNIKLIITADLYSNQEIKDYIFSKRLQYDVLSLPNVSSKVLAALNQLAICAVNPSLFEGGFPFTFAEAYSVGTPSVMSQIPVVTPDIEDKELQKIMLFDPCDLNDMVNKIEWAIKNSGALFDLQKPLYDKFKHRTWNIVAKEYIDLLSKFAVSGA